MRHKGLTWRWILVGVFVWFGLFAAGSMVKKLIHSSLSATVEDDDNNVPGTTHSGLRIECRNDDESIKTSELDWKDGYGPLRRKFLRVRIYNDGPRVAKRCAISLEGVTEVTAHGLVPTEYDSPGLLIWSGDPSTDADGKVVSPNGNPAVADLFYTVRKPLGDEIYLKDARYSSFLKLGRSYSFEVVATAEGLKSVSKTIKVRFGPSWNDFDVIIQ